ncbi:MAG: hypothetical protein A2937_02275 [Candidatus Yonathbacteria bacterium RIFCSPLOWO2_01_FULL_47_33b]|uniref:t-SNARE coiled-coil homology domain-containing protein n=1 Tax=Candidatus Yonathbacteria bacterium RIFCSPLOWO2_01_FULL_47_33b TaxID=1802727 RepID=A0A1G2SED3_9BACT|nr:MAG: hypothetical protein A2937_02275 [Candidatus Yonathbacteria bacterium RIFCSPLOWO2_01_FULL_47_33b]
MKKATNKKMTIDDLAVMVAKGFAGVDKKFDGVYRKFDEVDNKFAEVKKEISEVKKDVAEVKENLASTRRDVLAMGDKFTLKYEFHDLASRVSLLEQKRKVKR